MKDDAHFDWERWVAQEPPLGFVDRVSFALDRSSAEDPGQSLRSRRGFVRTMATFGAAATALASFAVLAAVLQSSRSDESAPRSAESATPSVAEGRAPRAEEPPRAGESEAPAAGGSAAVGLGSTTVIDRKLRDAVRARLGPTLGKRVEVDPHTGLTVPSGPHRQSPQLTKEYIQARVREDFYPLARSCYEAALARLPGLRGRLVLSFIIVGDAKVGGIVDQAIVDPYSSIDDPEFATCMRESMLSMVFAPPSTDGWVTVTYPFSFAPGDEEPDAEP